jgi:hypothetical protein
MMQMEKSNNNLYREWVQEYYPVAKGEMLFRMDYNYDDIYDHYKSKYDPKMNKILFKRLCGDFNLMLNNDIVTKSFEFKLPYRLGSVRIRTNRQKIAFKDDGKLDTKKMSIDWGGSWKMWREIYPDKTYKEIMETPNKKILMHTNEHSNGYIMRWLWDKRLSNTRNQLVYIFRPVKGGYKENEDIYFGKRGLSSWIKNDERTNEYFE